MFRITGYAEGKMKSKKEIKAYIKATEDQNNIILAKGGRTHEARIMNASIIHALNWVLNEDKVKVVRK